MSQSDRQASIRPAPTGTVALWLMASLLVLCGCGGEAQITVEPNSISFGEIELGTTGDALLEITNNGSGPTTVVFDLDAGTPFRVDVDFPIEVPEASARFVFIEFSPTEEGISSAVLRLLWGENRTEVALQATGVAAVGDNDRDGFSVDAGDCDDNDPTINPEASELCDAVDNNCNEEVDEGFDLDGDGVTNCGPDGDVSTLDDNDCDDDDANNYPGNTETCEEGSGAEQQDNNCDPSDDSSARSTWHRDGDGDGVGAVIDPVIDEVLSCASPGADFVLALEDPDDPDGWLLDCDDSDPGNYPGNTESCDGADNDCSGDADFTTTEQDGGGEADSDADGALDCEDCEDDNAENLPGAVEVCDGQDNNCDGATDENANDSDGDGFGCTDCDDTDELIYPGATEVCDGADTDCNGFDDFGNPGVAGGETDDDGDGQTECEGDCDDDPATGSNNFTGNDEACDGLDNDCSGSPDFTTTNDDGGGEADSDADTSLDCADCDDSDPSSFPGNPESCDGVDNDCNGSADFITTNDDGGGEADSDADTSLDCEDCEDGNAGNFPGNTELCDGVDNDCSAGADFITVTDDGGGETSDSDGDGALDCEDCEDGNADNFPGNAELCDGLDNDCNAGADFVSAIDDGGGENADSDSDGSLNCADCADSDHNNFPGNAEACDGQDNDCNGSADFTTAANDGGGEVNSDADGFLDCADCNDIEDTAYPGAPELCDAIDNDCDTVIDGADATGLGAACAGASCLDVLNSRISPSADGLYWVTLNDLTPFQAHCDMSSDGGGWTLVASKESITFGIGSDSLDTSCASSTSSNCDSAIFADSGWSTVMWRFASNNDVLVFADKTANSGNGFSDWLEGNGSSGTTTTNITFYKSVSSISSPSDSVQSAMNYTEGVSELGGGSDLWLNLWSSQDASNNYIQVEDDNLRGRKCIAGHCRSSTVWMMIR